MIVVSFSLINSVLVYRMQNYCRVFCGTIATFRYFLFVYQLSYKFVTAHSDGVEKECYVLIDRMRCFSWLIAFCRLNHRNVFCVIFRCVLCMLYLQTLPQAQYYSWGFNIFIPKWKRRRIVIISLSDSEAFRLRCCLPSVTGRRFFFNSISKFLSNSSIIQKISVTLSLVIIIVNFVIICLSDLKMQNNSVITNF